MKNKDLSKQFYGAENGITGYGYEKIFFVDRLVNMLLSGGNHIVDVTRTKRDAPVDDVVEKTKNGDIYYQCRKYAEYDKKLFSPLFIQFTNDKSAKICIVTQNKDKHYSKLNDESRKYEYKEFINYLNKDSQLKKHKEKFHKLCNWLINNSKKKEENEYFIYRFLKNFQIEVWDEIRGEEKTKEKLELRGYSSKEVENIYNKLCKEADDKKWQDKAINIEELKQILKYFRIEYRPREEIPQINDKPESHKYDRKIKYHILENPKVIFYEKISYIFDLINNINKPRKAERKQALKIIEKNSSLSWHFLRNLKDVNWFPEIKNGLIKYIIQQKVDRAVKFQLLNYFELCLDKHVDEIVPLLIAFEKNIKNPSILIVFVKILAKIKFSSKKDLIQIEQILSKLAKHPYSLLRKEIPLTLSALSKYDLDKSLKILKDLLLFTIKPEDITLGSPTFGLNFQGKDLEDMVFKESAKLLNELMAEGRFAIKTFDLAINLEIQFIKRDRGKLETIANIIVDYSSIWLSREGLDKLEYIYDHKERIALEIERSLEKYAISDIELTKQLCPKLLEAKYEVFYLAVIKVLTKHPEQYIDLIEGIVFNKDLWVIHSIQNYFLQTLIKKYFELKQIRLSEYIQEVRALTYKGDSESASYFKQDLLLSIPEKLRVKNINKELEQLNVKLGTENEITKPFEIRTWTEPLLDISLEVIKIKSDDDLVHIMEEGTSGKRKSDPGDLANLYKDFIKDSPDRLKGLLDKMEGKEIAPYFSSEMIKGYLRSNKADLQVVINLFWKVQKSDNPVRLEIARFLYRECINKEIVNTDPKLIGEIKKVLFDLILDKDPENDNTIKSSNPRPDDALTRGINSIRGVAVEVLIVLLHYFPKDKDIPEKIMFLSEDPTNAVKSTLLYNLRFLAKNNFDLCQSIVAKFKNKRDPEIDFGLLYYFSSLNSSKRKNNLAFIKLLFNNKNKEIQKMLGKLIGEHYIFDNSMGKLINRIVKGNIGEKETRISIAFIFESRLEKLIQKKKYSKVIKLLVKLMDVKQEPGVRIRASYFLDRHEFKTDYFRILYENKIFDVILKDETNITVQSHVINYLHRCILEGKFVEQCIDILYKQTMKIDRIWDDQLIVNIIAEIIKNRLQNMSENGKADDKIDEIFDKGLEKGWEEFYKFFYEFKQETVNN